MSAGFNEPCEVCDKEEAMHTCDICGILLCDKCECSYCLEEENEAEV